MEKFNNEKNYNQSEKEKTYLPNTLDIVLIDGKFTQCIAVHPDVRTSFVSIEDKSVIIDIEPNEWNKYDFIPAKWDVHNAKMLVEKGLMSHEQFIKVHWSTSQEENNKLQGLVTYFGSLNIKK